MPAEDAGAVHPAARRANRIDWIRDPDRLRRRSTGIPARSSPLTIDLPAGPAGALPQGGETTVDFPNNHLGYAYTWFGLALLTPAILLAVLGLARQGSPRPQSLPR